MGVSSRSNRRGEAVTKTLKVENLHMKGNTFIVTTAQATVFLIFSIVLFACSKQEEKAPLTFYCAAGIKPPVEKTVSDYSKESGVQIQVQYGGSGTLLSNLQIAKTGDLYLAADDSYIHQAKEKGLLAESIPIATMRPVIAVQKGNPKGIHSVGDLLCEEVAVALANPDAAAVGRIIRKILKKTGEWDTLKEHTRVFKPTVNEIANDIRIGAVDAGIIWDSVGNQYEQIENVHVEAFDAKTYQITVGVLTSSENPTEALKFARYLSARDRGQHHFADLGYEPVEGDVFEVHPEILLFSGAMLRPGLEKAIQKFEQREGVTVNRVYNGCGILVSQMNSGTEPEVYVSCDVSFMEIVQGRFLSSKLLTENDMVILVKKGNSKQIQGLQDLARADVVVGLAHPEKSALGELTRRMLVAEDLYEQVAANKKVDSATGDFLVNQIRAGSLDAVIVYRSNAMSAPVNLEKHLDLIEIDAKNATAIQSYAIAKNAKHKRLLERLFDIVMDNQSKSTFESFGFRWRQSD